MTNRSRYARFALCALLLLSQTGCFEIIEDIWLLADGGARFRVQLVLPMDTIEFARSKGQDPVAEIQKGFTELKAQLSAIAGVRKLDFKTEADAGKFRIVYDIEVQDATQLGDVVRKATVPLDMPGTQATLAGLSIKINRNPDGSVSFAQRFEPLTVPPEDGGLPPEKLKELRRFASTQVFGDNALTLTLHGDIKETNADKRLENGAATWSIPIPMLLAPEGDPRTLTATTARTKSNPAPLIIGAVVLACLLALVLRRVLRRAPSRA